MKTTIKTMATIATRRPPTSRLVVAIVVVVFVVQPLQQDRETCVVRMVERGERQTGVVKKCRLTSNFFSLFTAVLWRFSKSRYL